MSSYKELRVWQRSMDLVREIYKLTKLLPKDELYGLVNQMRRAVVSIPSNIAEGQGRETSAEFVRFLYIARGSYYEIETQLKICVMLEYVDETEIETASSLSQEVGKMLNALIRSKKTSN